MCLSINVFATRKNKKCDSTFLYYYTDKIIIWPVLEMMN